MKKGRKITALIFIYLLLTTLLWAFSVSYSNSYNRMNEKKITPAGITIKNEKFTVNMLHSEFSVDIKLAAPESRLYYFSYFLSSDSMRVSQAVLINTVKGIVS